MYDFKYKIHYVIFTDRQNCQVIETKLIQKLIKEVSEVISIGSSRYILTNVNLFIDVVDIKQEFVMEKKLMSKLEELIQELCPDGVRFKSIKEVYQRVKGTPITAGKMKEIENNKGDIRVFAGGKTVINAYEKDIPKANITRVPAVLVQSRGIIDVIYYEKPFTFKNEMWAYTHQEKISVKFLY